MVTPDPSGQDRFQEEVVLREVTESRIRDLMEQLDDALGQVERLRQDIATLRSDTSWAKRKVRLSYMHAKKKRGNDDDDDDKKGEKNGDGDDDGAMALHG